MKSTLAFTGHRPKRLLANHTKEAIADVLSAFLWGPTPHWERLITGGALGLDMLAAARAQAFCRGCGYTAHHILALPWDGYNQHWSEDRREFAAVIESRADQVLHIGEHPKDWGDMNDNYHARNRWMVDNCTTLLGFWDGKRRGGTFETLKYAVNREGVEVLAYRLDRPGLLPRLESVDKTTFGGAA